MRVSRRTELARNTVRCLRDQLDIRHGRPRGPTRQTDQGSFRATAGLVRRDARDPLWYALSGGRAPLHRQGRVGGRHFFTCRAHRPLEPGEPNSIYHWETEAEAFFIISGEALLIVEGQERPLRQWDFASAQDRARDRRRGRRAVRRAGHEFAREPAVGPYGEYTENEVASKYGPSRLRRPRRTRSRRTRTGPSRSRPGTARAGCRARRRGGAGGAGAARAGSGAGDRVGAVSASLSEIATARTASMPSA